MSKYNYIVGFEDDSQCVYGKDIFDKHYGHDIPSFTRPMTIYQAIRQLKSLSGSKKAIYKLIKIDPKKEKFKQKILNQMVKK